MELQYGRDHIFEMNICCQSPEKIKSRPENVSNDNVDVPKHSSTASLFSSFCT